MENIKRKAKFDELNKSKDLIGENSSCKKSTGRVIVPKMYKCSECGRVFDINVEGICSSNVLCGKCL